MKLNTLILALILFVLTLMLNGCALRPTGLKLGDDQFLKGQVIAKDVDMAMARLDSLESEMRVLPQVSAQMGAINTSMQKMQEQRYDISAGGDSIFNDPDMIKDLMGTLERLLTKFFIIMGIIIILPMIEMMLIYNKKNDSR